jgi:hypothetical protein
MITIQDTLLNTQSPLLLQLDIAPDRTLLLVCEFLRLLPERLEEGSSQQNFDDSSTNPGSAEIAQVVQRDDSKEGIEDIVWVMKLYERLHTEVILRERAASVRVSTVVAAHDCPVALTQLTDRSYRPRSYELSLRHARPPARSFLKSLKSASSSWVGSPTAR